MGFGVADDSAFTDVAAAGFELRLDEDDGFSECGRGGEDGWEDKGGADEGDVCYQERKLGGFPGGVQRSRSEQASVGALYQRDAGVVAELHGDLAEAGVEGGDVGCAVLEKAVGEAAGGGADVEAGAAGDGDLPMVEGGFQLEAAAADVALLFAEQTDGGVGGDGGARLVDFLLVDQDAAGEDERAGTLAAGHEGTLDECQVKTDFQAKRLLFQELSSTVPAAAALWEATTLG